MTDDAPDVVWRGPDDLRDRLVPIDTLTPDPANANTHPEKNLRTIRGSLAQYGQQKPIVVSPTGVIVAGNGLWTVLREQPVPAPGRTGELEAQRWTHVAAVRSDLSPAELVGFGITDNRSQQLSEWDLDVLASHLGGLDQDGVDLAALGWDEDDMQSLLGDFDMGDHADDDQPRLDQREPVECPACGVRFDPKTQEIAEGV